MIGGKTNQIDIKAPIFNAMKLKWNGGGGCYSYLSFF